MHVKLFMNTRPRIITPDASSSLFDADELSRMDHYDVLTPELLKPVLMQMYVFLDNTHCLKSPDHPGSSQGFTYSICDTSQPTNKDNPRRPKPFYYFSNSFSVIWKHRDHIHIYFSCKNAGRWYIYPEYYRYTPIKFGSHLH